MAMTILHAGGTADTGELFGGAVESTANAVAGVSRGTIRCGNDSSYRIRCIDPETGPVQDIPTKVRRPRGCVV